MPTLKQAIEEDEMNAPQHTNITACPSPIRLVLSALGLLTFAFAFLLLSFSL
jgi:hypothetical protein